MDYDIIGDIHGHADELKILLQKLGYQKTSEGVFAQPGRQVIYVGDFIDRGLQNLKVLGIVKPMVEQGHALAVMGNHEFNAICFHTRHPETGLPLRKYDKNYGDGHLEFLSEIKGKEEILDEIIDWFKSLPLFLDLEELRVIHAAWNFDFIEQLKKRGGSDIRFIADDNFFFNSAIKETPEYHIIETLLKGSKVEFPAENYPATDKFLFFGHYWMCPDTGFRSANSLCVDYSVARRGGALCSYRWSSCEEQLREENILFVSSAQAV